MRRCLFDSQTAQCAAVFSHHACGRHTALETRVAKVDSWGPSLRGHTPFFFSAKAPSQFDSLACGGRGLHVLAPAITFLDGPRACVSCAPPSTIFLADVVLPRRCRNESFECIYLILKRFQAFSHPVVDLVTCGGDRRRYTERSPHPTSVSSVRARPPLLRVAAPLPAPQDRTQLRAAPALRSPGSRRAHEPCIELALAPRPHDRRVLAQRDRAIMGHRHSVHSITGPVRAPGCIVPVNRSSTRRWLDPSTRHQRDHQQASQHVASLCITTASRKEHHG